ncbi:MAG TPA: hypothetical protein P5534_06925 [Candidatus Paceibacterota bacterium]|nr:hypothetical protein [Candidatus Paceibacterota bacterium]
MAKSIALKMRVDDRAPDFEAQDQDGEIVSPAAPRRGRAGALKA